MPVAVGIAECASCGATVGTVFSETDIETTVKATRKRKKVTTDASDYERIEKAKDHANNSLILSLASFFLPFIGAALAIAAILLGGLALRVMAKNKIEDGRGSAIGGLIIGVIGVIAQVGYAIYFFKLATWNPFG
ncbi:MAG TPA: DUF4190 domain-containing protein [Blastocatellia bacterium]|nr:DUF4190 domain-containing protein [Blastocatellia bacterium]